MAVLFHFLLTVHWRMASTCLQHWHALAVHWAYQNVRVSIILIFPIFFLPHMHPNEPSIAKPTKPTEGAQAHGSERWKQCLKHAVPSSKGQWQEASGAGGQGKTPAPAPSSVQWPAPLGRRCSSAAERYGQASSKQELCSEGGLCSAESSLSGSQWQVKWQW